jgi:predicted transposase/invertase (TIGR01784 family)
MTETDTTNAQPGEMKTPKKRSKRKNFDYDGFWKDLIKKFFYYLLKRALPELYEAANRQVAPRFLDKEFTDVLNTGDPKIHTSPHFADYVLEVPLKNGDVEWVLLHLEIQGRGGDNFAVRMRVYECLIFAHYQREPVALAIITDKRPANEPMYYSYSRYGTESFYKYGTIILSELDDEELKTSDNPIDLAFYSAKCALRSKEELQKYTYLRTLTGLLTERGWSRDEKRDLLLFMMRIINLKDEALKELYWEYRQQLDKEGKLMYEPFLKEVEEKKAEERGMEKMAQKMAKNLLNNGVPPDVIAKSAELPLDKIQRLMN